MIRLSTFDLAKQRQQFVRSGERMGCCNCQHGKETLAERSPPWDKSSWRCTLGGFFVTAFAICNEHKPVTPSQGYPRPSQGVHGGEIDVITASKSKNASQAV